MSGQYRLDRRDRDGLVAALARSAASAALPPWLADELTGYHTWADLLFDDDRLADPGEPSQALLAALADAHVGLRAHLNTLPDRARRWYVAERLGIRPLAARPDRVTVVAEAEPDQPPAVIPAGSDLRAKDPAGGERRYRTTTTLTVLGTGVLGVRAHRADGETGTIARHDGPVEERFEPFAAARPAPHELVIASPLLRFDARSPDETLHVHLEFYDVQQAAALTALTWTYSTGDGQEVDVLEGGASPQLLSGGWRRLTVTLRGTSCRPGAVGDEQECYLRGSLDAGAGEEAFTLAFGRVRLWVERRQGDEPALPDTVAHNAGLLDAGREFQPFGPVPQRGDAFYVRSDEAFGKPLEHFRISLELFGGESREPVESPFAIEPQTLNVEFLGNAAISIAAIEQVIGELGLTLGEAGIRRTPPPVTRLVWESFDGRAWQFLRSETLFRSTTVTAVGGARSQPTAVAGVAGHWVRVLLQDGDFGWSQYQRRLAQLASAAAGESVDLPSPEQLVPPDPPILSAVGITYRTAAAPATAVRARNGLHETRLVLDDGPARRPFARRPFTEHHEEATGELILGLDLNDAGLGATVAVHLDLASASGCAPWDPDKVTATWEYRASDGWTPVDVLDGTRSLRQSGIVRLVAPPDWREGAPDLGEDGGRWLRVLLPRPAAAGTLVAVLPDAVEAHEVLATGAEDIPPRAPLPSEAVSGLVSPVTGIKSLTNPRRSSGAAGSEPSRLLFPRAADILKHRERVVTAPGVEAHVRREFDEVAVVRCLPHTSFDSSRAPGWIGVVLVPDSDGPRPLPSLDLVERVGAKLRTSATPHLRVAVRCPDYVEVRVEAVLRLRPGHAAATAVPALEQALEEYLHPLGTRAGRAQAAAFGAPLYRSELVAVLEARPEVVALDELRLLEPGDDPERVDVDPCVGLIASAGGHRILARETL